MPISRRDFLAAASGLASLRLVPAPQQPAPDGPAEAPVRLATLPSGVSCDGLRSVNAWQIGSSLVLACAFGSDPVQLGGGRWRGSGLSFRHVRANQTDYLLESLEGDFDIDYWANMGGLHIVQYTFVVDGHQLVPLFEHVFDVRDFPARRSLVVMLQAPAGAADRLAAALFALRGPQRGRASDLYENLYRIRDFGLLDPDRALSKLAGVRGAWWDDGEVAEVATSVRAELELVVRTRAHRVA